MISHDIFTKLWPFNLGVPQWIHNSYPFREKTNEANEIITRTYIYSVYYLYPVDRQNNL